MCARFFAVFVLFAPVPATEQIVRVVNGDTLVVESASDRYRIRLADIDVPERSQPWRQASTWELRRSVAGEQVVVS